MQESWMSKGGTLSWRLEGEIKICIATSDATVATEHNYFYEDEVKMAPLNSSLILLKE